MTEDQTSPEHVRGIFDNTLLGEPPLVDMVSGAVHGARTRQRRDRMVFAAAPLAVVALAVSAYALAPGGSGSGTAGNSATSGGATKASPTKAPTSTAPEKFTPAKDPFADYGTPEQSCHGNWPDYVGPYAVPRTKAQLDQECVNVLTSLRALLPGDKVVLQHIVSLTTGGDGSGQDLVMNFMQKAKDGDVDPAIAKNYAEIINNPSDPRNTAMPASFLVDSPAGRFSVWAGYTLLGQGTGSGDCKDGKSSGTVPRPCENIKLADGRSADVVQSSNGVFAMYAHDAQKGQLAFLVAPDTGKLIQMGQGTRDDGSAMTVPAKYVDLSTGTMHAGAPSAENPYSLDEFKALVTSPRILDTFQKVVAGETGK